jgi:hypothetical protein
VGIAPPSNTGSCENSTALSPFDDSARSRHVDKNWLISVPATTATFTDSLDLFAVNLVPQHVPFNITLLPLPP